MKTAIIRNCPLCGLENNITKINRYSTDTWILKNCRGCNFLFLENPVENKLFEDELAWEKTFYKNEIQKTKSGLLRSIFRKRLAIFPRTKISKIISKFSRRPVVLDVGCGVGKTLNSVEFDFIPLGIEISKYQSSIANKSFRKKGGGCIGGDATKSLSFFEDSLFDIIILRSFLEHENEPMRLLKELHKKLKFDGLVYIKVPNYNSLNRFIMGKRWCGFRFPEHVNYFTTKSLKNLIKKCGFEIYKFGFFDKLPTNDNMHIIIKKTY